MINRHNEYVEWWKIKLNVSDYGIAWISFIKGLIIGLFIHHFFYLVTNYPYDEP